MGLPQTSQLPIPAPAVLETGMVNLTGGDHWRVLSNATEVHRLAVSRIPDAIPERFAGCAPLQAGSTLLIRIATTTLFMKNLSYAKSIRHSIISYKKSICSTRQKSTNQKLEIGGQHGVTNEGSTEL